MVFDRVFDKIREREGGREEKDGIFYWDVNHKKDIKRAERT